MWASLLAIAGLAAMKARHSWQDELKSIQAQSEMLVPFGMFALGVLIFLGALVVLFFWSLIELFRIAR